ncbi:hypothetical protein, partial [Moorena sp. SIO2C4]|uniref:hypothetical protein n=1 Tax=Moorena sp. SIO2C4 TaxID=2607824 RepID=UPI00257990A2
FKGECYRIGSIPIMQILTRGRGGYLGDTEDGEDSEDGTEVMFHHTKLIHTSHLLPPPAWEW